MFTTEKIFTKPKTFNERCEDVLKETKTYRMNEHKGVSFSTFEYKQSQLVYLAFMEFKFWKRNELTYLTIPYDCDHKIPSKIVQIFYRIPWVESLDWRVINNKFDFNYTKYASIKSTKKGNWVVALYDLNKYIYLDHQGLKLKEIQEMIEVKWVSNDSKKRLCYPTMDMAIVNMYYRLKVQHRILLGQVENCERKLSQKPFMDMLLEQTLYE